MVVSPSLVNVSPSVQIQTNLECGVSHCKVRHIFFSKDILCQTFESHYTANPGSNTRRHHLYISQCKCEV